ncbi:MAG TPA: PAS domain S-box protein, partial [Candidatus Aminicenantes bacterium]|nr:PAS domain S-box protein [Candidatus Aminicenantes bacterium]
MAGEEEATSELVVVDVRRYRNVKKALYASEERFRALFENIPIGIYRTTEDGRIIDANPAFVSMLGFSSRDELSEHHRAGEFYVQPGRRNEIISHLRREGVIHGAEALFRRSDGREIVVRQSITLIREPKGNDFYMEGSVEDITEIRRSQEALRRHTQQLEALNHIIASGHQASSMNEFLQAVLRITLEFSGMEAGGVYLIDGSRRLAQLAVERGLLGEFADQVRTGSIDQP